MNFGKHGRTALLAALVASTSSLVFGGLLPGVASAASSTTKIDGVVVDGSNTEGHTLGACFTADTTANTSTKALTLKVEGIAPTTGGVLLSTTVPPDSVTPFDISDALSNTKTDPNKGWHVKMTIGGKTKSFWIDDADASCSVPPTLVAKTGKHALKPAKLPATSSTCHTENGFLQSLQPAAGGNVSSGSTVGLTFNDESVLDMSSLKFTFDGNDVTADADINPPEGGKVVTVTYQIPKGLAKGVHSASVYAKDSDHTEDCGSAAWDFTVDGTTTTQACVTQKNMFGAQLPDSTSVLTPGGLVGVVYQDPSLLVQSTLNFQIDGQQITPIYDAQPDGTVNIWYYLPTTITAGSHSVAVNGTDTAGNCGSKNFKFQSSGVTPT